MEKLLKAYQKKLDAIMEAVQASEELQTYLDTEEEDDYGSIRSLFEPQIAAIYEEVANQDPLQLVPLERHLLQEGFEGLFLPRILGYAVLRGELNQLYKYRRPQEQFKLILHAICNSSNFDILKKRIGQTIQVGFALSSDIWITDLINEVDNKKVRYFLVSQKLKKYQDHQNRRTGYVMYSRQFRNDIYFSAEFPKDLGQLKVLFSSLFAFLKKRILLKLDNKKLDGPIIDFLTNDSFKGTKEYVYLLGLYANFFQHDEKHKTVIREWINQQRKDQSNFCDVWFSFLLEMNADKLDLNREADLNASSVIDKSIKDEVSAYYTLTDEIHSKGFSHEDSIQSVNAFYAKQEGLSDINQCVRNTIYHYFAQILNNLDETEYTELFELSKLYPVYMGVFDNQQFNQDLKDLSLSFVKKLLKKYTDKRGKDYQDIKRFVSATFKDLKFMKEKQIVELFKSRRKRKKEE